MAKKKSTPLGWGSKFRELAKAKGLNLGQIAEKMELAESTVRSWTNGTRAINLDDFLDLCTVAEIDPAVVLFASKVDERFLAIGEAWSKANALQREVLRTAAHGILAQIESAGNKTTDSAPSATVRG